jgi:N-acetylglucosamine kinase-like BadF-type ATPase
LKKSVNNAVGVENLDQLVDWAWEAERHAIAALAKVVCRDAVAGDEVARDIVHTAAVDLAALVASLAGSFGLYSEVNVAFSGGVLSEDSPVRWELTEYLADRLPNATILEKPVDPVSGALSIASRLLTL